LGRDPSFKYLKNEEEEMKKLITDLGLDQRVDFGGALSLSDLRSLYRQYPLCLNMASETIDKTMLEALVNGCYVATTPGNSRAIGLTKYPAVETAEALANFVLSGQWQQFNLSQMQEIVSKNHSLSTLIKKMNI
jgi:glycosyltransferase involved in cell wall biosynthesis